MQATDVQYRESSAMPGTPNPAWVNGGVCNDLVSGPPGPTLQNYASGNGGEYLIYAVEMMDLPSPNPNNNFNGICEAGETCIYSPNAGYYLGTGDPTADTCTVQSGGALTAASPMYRYPDN